MKSAEEYTTLAERELDSAAAAEQRTHLGKSDYHLHRARVYAMLATAASGNVLIPALADTRTVVDVDDDGRRRSPMGVESKE